MDRIFRVFISSTFTDMKLERQLLHEKVFPKLEEYCSANNAKFQPIDLRWGVTEESQLNHEAMQICLNEIKRCQEISPKPNFLVLLGDKYGWQPIPTVIPESEWTFIIESIVNSSDKELIQYWYRRDENAIPVEYVLRCRTGKYEKYNEWDIIEKRIRNILKEVTKKSSFSDKQKAKYFFSATHHEIIKGILNPIGKQNNAKDHLFVFNRTIEKLPLNTELTSYIDIEDDKLDIEAKKQLDSLKNELKYELKENQNYLTYNATWKEKNIILDDDILFVESVYKKLKKVIELELSSLQNEDSLDFELNKHSEFKDELVRHFNGRDNLLKEIESHIENENNIFFLSGNPGTGKSSVMAKAVQNLINKNTNELIIYRFLGITPDSTDPISLIKSIIKQIYKEIDSSEPNDLYLNYSSAMRAMLDAINRVRLKKPIIIFLDALDQLNIEDNYDLLSWLSGELPINVKLIVSSLPEKNINKQVQYSRKVRLVPPLAMSEASTILTHWLDTCKRRITIDQNQYILEKVKHNPSPLYLRLLFLQVKKWNSFQSNINLKDSIEELIIDYVKILEIKHTKEFVKNVICYLLCGRYNGLTESELLDVLVLDEESWNSFLSLSHPEHINELKKIRRIPFAVWSRLYNDLKPFLVERKEKGAPIISFFHRQFNRVLSDHYKLD